MFKAGDLAPLREKDPASFVAKVADGMLHEVLSHQLGAGPQNDWLIFTNYEPGSFGHKAQQADPYFQSRKNTLFDHLQWRAGNFRQVRPLYKDDQKKVEERLKPITRKYKD